MSEINFVQVFQKFSDLLDGEMFCLKGSFIKYIKVDESDDYNAVAFDNSNSSIQVPDDADCEVFGEIWKRKKSHTEVKSV